MNSKMLFVLLAGLNQGLVFMNIPPALSILMEQYAVSYTEISILISALFWSHAFTQLPAGMVTDKFGLKRTLFASFACMAVGNLVPAAIPDFRVAILGRAITGLGTGVCFVAMVKLVALYAPGGRAGTYQAFFGGFFSIGSILAYLVIPETSVFGWQGVYLLPGVSSLTLLAVLIGLRLDKRSKSVVQTLWVKRILLDRAGWTIGIYHALSWGAVMNLGSWIPSILAEAQGSSTATHLAWGGALVMLISGVARLTGGFVLLRLSSKRLANATVLILSFIFLGLFLFRLPGIVLPLTLLGAWFASFNFGAHFHLASCAAESEWVGTFIGFMNFLANVGAILITVMFGYVKDTFGSFFMGVWCALSFGPHYTFRGESCNRENRE